MRGLPKRAGCGVWERGLVRGGERAHFAFGLEIRRGLGGLTPNVSGCGMECIS